MLEHMNNTETGSKIRNESDPSGQWPTGPKAWLALAVLSGLFVTLIFSADWLLVTATKAAVAVFGSGVSARQNMANVYLVAFLTFELFTVVTFMKARNKRALGDLKLLADGAITWVFGAMMVLASLLIFVAALVSEYDVPTRSGGLDVILTFIYAMLWYFVSASFVFTGLKEVSKNQNFSYAKGIVTYASVPTGVIFMLPSPSLTNLVLWTGVGFLALFLLAQEKWYLRKLINQEV